MSTPAPMVRGARRLEGIPFSGIRRVVERTTELERSGARVVHFEIGRPDFDSPDHVKQAAIDALRAGQVHYSSNYGLPGLRSAIAAKLERENKTRYRPEDEIIVTVGANEAVLLAFLALLDPADEVIVPDPAWLHYRWCAELCGARTVTVACSPEAGFRPDPAVVERAITDRTRVLVVNTPHNPTGVVYDADLLAALAEVARRRDLIVLSDEIYERLTYDGARHVSMASLPGMWDRVVTVNGFSKAYSMTGWRLGYVAAPKPIADLMIRVHQYTTVCAVTFAQAGAIAAYEGDQRPAREMVAAFDSRRRTIVEGLNALAGVTCQMPRGAFYAFPDVRGTGLSSSELAEILLEEAYVAVVPGEAFGPAGSGHVRISYARAEDELREGLRRMAKVLTQRPGAAVSR